MIRAFVFGKFLPFHKGHKAMINFALSKCNYLSVLVCCSDKENILDSLRKNWIEETFSCEKNIEVKIFNYEEDKLPNTSVTSKNVSAIWATVFKELYPDYTLLITSESYGNFVAEFMNIQHLAFDIAKEIYPVSATAIRNNLFANWQFLPDSVKHHYVLKIVILGTECTGKTTLTKMLTEHYDCSMVLETARDLIPNSNDFTFDALHLVAHEHSKNIKNAVIGSTPLVIIDTDIHITKSYSKFTFGKDLNVSDEIHKINQANLYLYLNNDVNYIQDGTRLSYADRNILDISHRQILTDHNIDVVEIKGNWEERLKNAVEQINELISNLADNRI